MIPPCPAQGLASSSLPGQSCCLHDFCQHISRKKKIPKDAPLPRGGSKRVSSPLGQQGWCGSNHVLLLIRVSASGSNSQHLHRGLNGFAYASGVLGLNLRPSAVQQAWMLKFRVRLAPEEPSFVQLCQNF